MDTLSRSNIAQRRFFLEEEERRLSKALSSVRESLNSLVPISWLPPEILEEIFSFCATWLYGSQKPLHRLSWCQVCRSWRNISLNSGRLWRFVDLCEGRFARESLVRSKSGPISVISSSPLKACTEKLDLDSGRLQSIDLFFFPKDMVEIFSSMGSHFPTLTNLSLKIPPVSSSFTLDITLPSVRSLVLDCVAIPWGQRFSLTHLSLRGLSPEFSPTIPQLHTIFEASPYLEYVKLGNISPTPSAPSSHQRIALPYLRELIISAKAPIIASIMRPLYFSQNARVQLYFSPCHDLHTVFPNGLPYLQGPGTLDIKSIRLGRQSVSFLRPSAHSWSEDLQKVSFLISSASTISKSILVSLNHLLDLSYITVLELGTGFLLDTPSQVLEEFFAATHNLETLRIAFNDLKDILRIFTFPDPTTRKMICPRLTWLSFSRPGDLWWHFCNNWLQLVMECVNNRRLHGYPLRKLEFFRCHGVSRVEYEEKLNKLVPEISIIEYVESH